MREFKAKANQSQFNKKMSDYLKSIQKELDTFYNTSIKQPSVFFIDSRKEIDNIWGRKTEDWFSSWAKDGNVFILHPDIYTKESSHKDIQHFWQSIKHEYCHLYYRNITGTGCPKWLNEGLANYLAGQIKKRLFDQDALRVFEYFNKSDWQVYDIGYFWTKLLVNKFSKEKITTLIKQINSKTTEKDFAKIFYAVYKIDYSKAGFKKLLNL